MKILLRLFITFCALFSTELFAGNLKVNLAPAGAVSIGAQWRVDAGTWRNSGATVSNLTDTTHTVDYKFANGWITPAATTVTLTAGNTTTINTTYVQGGSLKVNLSPAAAVSANALWRVDGGAWYSSAATVGSLTPGTHLVEYSSVGGYLSPTAENVTLVSGQTTTLDRSYTQLASLRITLSPTSGRWRVDGGTWRTGGTTVNNLTPGAHTVDYNAVTGYSAPASESVTLTSGQTLALTRNYAQAGQAAQVTVSLTPSSGQWNIDGGTWQASGTTAGSVTPGAHTINYSSLAGYTAPASEAINPTAGQSLTLARSYVQLAQISISLVPTSGQWRANGGAWQSSGASVSVTPGSNLIEYAALADYDSPASESVTLAAGGNFTATRSYTTTQPTLGISLTPASGQWRIDGSAWQASGAVVSGLTAGTHSIDYTDIGGIYNPLVSEIITLALRENALLTRNYPVKPPASLSVTLDPTSAQWRVDGGAWQASGATVGNLTYGVPHSIEYMDIAYHAKPASESVTLASGQALSLNRSYNPVTLLYVRLNPTNAQWRVDGGSWIDSGTVISDFPLGTHTFEYSPVEGYITPPTETATAVSGQTLFLDRPYTPLAWVYVTLDPVQAQWRLDGGTWNDSGFLLKNVSLGEHTIEYSPVAGFITPASETVTTQSGTTLPINRSYAPAVASLNVTLNPSSAQWRFQGTSVWHASGELVSNLPLGNHTIEFSAVTGYITLPSETVTLFDGPNSLTRGYTLAASLTLNINPAGTPYRLDGGTWRSGNSPLENLSLGAHTIEYFGVWGYITPAVETINLVSGPNNLTRNYTPAASLSLTIDPASYGYRVDGGIWQFSNAPIGNLSLGAHTIEYAPQWGYFVPPIETVNLVSGPNNLSRTIVAKAILTLTVSPAHAQWRVDGGAWQTGDSIVAELALGNHTLEFAPLVGYVTPPLETVNLVSGFNPLIRTLSEKARLTLTVTPTQAQWRIDGGQWRDANTLIDFLDLGTHTLEFAPVAGYNTPPVETITLPSGLTTLTRAYTPATSLTVNVTPGTAQWRLQGETTWRNSGTTATDLTPGDRTIEYNSVWTYTLQPTETITLVAGSNTVTRSYTAMAAVTVNTNIASGRWRLKGTIDWFSRGSTRYFPSFGLKTIEFENIAGYVTPAAIQVTFVPGPVSIPPVTYTPLATLSITLNASAGQWRIDGGQWRNSGTANTVTNLLPGQHTIEYADTWNYVTPPTETVTLVGGPNNLTRTYTSAAVLTISLNTPDALWRVDGGPWMGVTSYSQTAYNLLPGQHTIEYGNSWSYIAPPIETVTLVAGPNNLTRTYAPFSTLTVTLNASDAQWRVDGGQWRNSGSSNIVYGLLPGQHTIEYGNTWSYIAPPIETVTLVAGPNNLTRTYAPFSTLTVSLNASGAQWRVDGGQWRDYTTPPAYYLIPGQHTIEYSNAFGYITPATETVTLVGGPNNLTRTYPAKASLTINLNPSSALWRIDGGPWLNSAPYPVYDILPGQHTIEYMDIFGLVRPPTETITLVGGPNSLTRAYSSAAAFSMNLSPAQGRWRADGGQWRPPHASAFDLSPGPHLIEYAPLEGYFAPATETVTVQTGNTPTLDRSYTTDPSFSVNPALASLRVVTSHYAGQWRIDGGAWTVSDTTRNNLAPGDHTVEFAPVPNLTTPASQTVTLVAGSNPPLSTSYGETVLSVTLNPSQGYYRLDSGKWMPSGSSINQLTEGPHTLEFASLFGYLTPPAETVILVSAPNYTNYITRTYAQGASVSFATTTRGARVRIDGGDWRVSNAFYFETFTPGSHTLEFDSVAGYLTPPTETVTLVSGYNYIARDYTKAASVEFNSTTNGARIRIDGGDWRFSNAGYAQTFTPGPHTLEYSPVAGYLTPPTETVTLVSGTNYIARNYAQAASAEFYSTTNGARIRIDGGDWRVSNAGYAQTFTPGLHTLEYSPVAGYLTPPTETVTLVSGTNHIVRNYSPAASVAMYTNNISIRYRVDGGAWISYPNSSGPLTPGAHTFEYAPIAGYFTPAKETLTLVSGNNSITRNYVSAANFLIVASGTASTTGAATFTTWSPDGTGFGLNEIGGTYGGGYLFRYSYTSGPTLIREFGGLPHDGLIPSELIYASDNHLYGLTATGTGDAADGTIFTINPDGSNYTPLHFFYAASDGSLPVVLYEGDDGLLYGNTIKGGSLNRGMVFRIAKDGTGFTALLNIGANSTDIVIPGSGLMLLVNGLLIPAFPVAP